MSYENDNVSTVESVPEEFTIVYDEKRTNVEDILHIADLSNLPSSVVKFEKIDPNNYTMANETDAWQNLTTGKIIDTTFINIDNDTSHSSTRPKVTTNLKVQLPIQQVTQGKIIDPLESTVLSTYTTYEPESFDLLSYLCEVCIYFFSTTFPVLKC